MPPSSRDIQEEDTRMQVGRSWRGSFGVLDYYNRTATQTPNFRRFLSLCSELLKGSKLTWSLGQQDRNLAPATIFQPLGRKGESQNWIVSKAESKRRNYSIWRSQYYAWWFCKQSKWCKQWKLRNSCPAEETGPKDSCKRLRSILLQQRSQGYSKVEIGGREQEASREHNQECNRPQSKKNVLFC